MDKFTFISNSPLATFNMGKRLGKRLEAGSTIAMIGELGCGKTLMTRGIGAGLEVPERRVNSPTFVLVNEYSGRLPVYHMDLYRLSNIEQGFEIGILDYLARASGGVLIVEWAEKIAPLLPEERLQVEFQVLSARKREILFCASGDKFSSLLKELKSK
ncbi:MAG: tRNA (adenosine(37)-N6)-threonylcarbamoyltransferase complex ATPase subunit type 1 TsaE [Dehalococcoidales bacterium]|nr:tRNA (adenosine(37)-N6)-threonylcarbamoyltransferase complex ATPase subunit type 1 TsaE [Dehalococcoidales bacterium]